MNPQTPLTPQQDDPARWVAALLTAAGSARVGKKWQCPAHGATGEHAASLSLGRGDDGRLLLFCHAGCGWPDILRALVVPMSAMWTPPATAPARHAALYLRRLRFPAPKAEGTRAERGLRYETEHPYGSPPFAWKVRYRHPTTGEKDLGWESLNAADEALDLTPRQRRARAVPGLLGRRQADFPLYYEAEVRMAMAADEPVLLVESESSVDALRKAGWYATTWSGGAADPPLPRLVDVLGGYPHAVLVPDNDDAGIACARKLIVANTVRHLALGEPGEDARDLLTRLGRNGFRAFVEAATGHGPAGADDEPAWSWTQDVDSEDYSYVFDESDPINTPLNQEPA